MNFLQVYNKYKNQYKLITEGNVKTLYPSIQRMVLKGQFNGLSYQELTDEQKEEFQKQFDTLVKMYSGGYVDMVTPNKQYRSWLYDMWAKSFDLFDKDDEQQNQFETGGLENLSKMLKQYEVICRSPKVDQQHKNIFNFKTFKELYDFIEDFRANNTKILQSKFKKVCDNDLYDVYAIYLKDKELFQQIYGSKGYDVGWCVVNSEKNMFEQYLKNINDCYYLWIYKGTNKPFALLHFDSGQFKDIHNNSLKQQDNPKVLDILFKLKAGLLYNMKGDLRDYNKLLPYLQQELKNKTQQQLNQMFIDFEDLSKRGFYVDVDTGLINNDTTDDINLHYIINETSLYIDQYTRELLISFGKVNGDFVCTHLNLKSLKGCPQHVGGSFWCSGNQLINLINGPKYVGKSYGCVNCGLLSLEGSPKNIPNKFDCRKNELTNLVGGPTSVGFNYECEHNQLVTLKGIATEIGGELWCYDNKLTSFQYCPKNLKYVECDDNLDYEQYKNS